MSKPEAPENCEANSRILKRRRKNELHKKNEIRRQRARIDGFRRRLSKQGLLIRVLSEDKLLAEVLFGAK